MVIDLRFVIIPDIHYLQDNHSSTNDVNTVRGDGPPTKPAGYKERLDFLIETLKSEKMKGLDFFIANGDLVHDDSSFLPIVKSKFDEVGVPYYVTYGNHDRATEQEWLDVWGYGRDMDVVFGDYAFLMPRSADETGARIPVNTSWLANKLNQYADKKGVLLVTHVPQTSNWRNSPDATEVRQILKQSKNLIGSVFSHVHGGTTTEKIDNLMFAMTGHFAHYGRNFYSIRKFEIDQNDEISSELYDVSHNRVIAKQVITKKEGKWVWQENECLKNDNAK